MHRNVSNWERAASLAAGTALLVVAAKRPRLRSLATTTGSGLIARAVTGYCPVNAAVGRDSRRTSTRQALAGNRGIHVKESITIRRPADELFRFWRQFSNLPRFMKHLDEVRELSPTLSVWTAKAPAGFRVKWEAEVINEIEGELIGWQSTDNADVATAGSVRFVPTAQGATEVHVHLQYEPPAGRLGAFVAGLFGDEPSQTIREDLRRLKAMLETGEIPVGQPQRYSSRMAMKPAASRAWAVSPS
jgi:uncharacterized membrane protein